MNGVRLMFCHWLQRLKINCFTRCTVHVLFSNTHSTHVIVIGCEILLLCTLIVKRLLLARCFSGQNFIIIGKTENKASKGTCEDILPLIGKGFTRHVAHAVISHWNWPNAGTISVSLRTHCLYATGYSLWGYKNRKLTIVIQNAISKGFTVETSV